MKGGTVEVPAQRRSLSISLPRDRVAPRLARRRLEELLAGAVPADRLRDLRMLVSELVANSVVHGRGTIRLDARLAGGTVRVEVVDQGDGMRARVREEDRPGGWGLSIVDELADRWGVFSGSTHVWFELDLPDR